MSKRLVEMAAEIVQAQASKSAMSSDEIVASLKEIFSALADMKCAELQDMAIGETVAGEAVSARGASQPMDPKESIQENKIVCLECYAEMRQLTAKHLAAHGLTPREYKKKWGFAMKQPLSAKALTKARSKAAKKRGLPEKLLGYLESRRRRKTEEAVMEPASAEPIPPEALERKRGGGGRSRKAAE